MQFRDRVDAGRRLAEALAGHAGDDCVVLALPRGGVPVAAEIARRLGAPLDLLLVRKIGVPQQPELAMGAVIDGAEPIVVRNREIMRMANVTEKEFQEVCERETREIERRRQRYLAARPQVEVAGKVAIIVDDGIATGSTAEAAIRGIRRRGPSRIVLAVPVAPPDTVQKFRSEVDEIVCLEQPEPFYAIGLHYSDFQQVSDQEVVALLDEFPEASIGKGGAKEGGGTGRK